MSNHPAPSPSVRDRLVRDPSLLDHFLAELNRFVRRRVGDKAYTEITVVLRGGAPVDIVEQRRWHADDFKASEQ